MTSTEARDYRNKRRWTVNHTAQAAQMRAEHVDRYERGTYQPTEWTLERLERALRPEGAAAQ